MKSFGITIHKFFFPQYIEIKILFMRPI